MLNSQKLESLGVLAGGIAHDFNNLLMSIIGNAELSQVGLNQSTEAARPLRDISLGANRAAELCRQILAYAGEVSPQREDHDLVELVAEISSLLRMSASKQCTISVRQADARLGINADASQISQLIINLIVYASDAIGDRPGTVTISTARVDTVSDAEHPGPGPFAMLEVRDDGVGMMPEVKERMFDPFFSTKFAGRGLGMATVQGIIHGHGGSIFVESEPSSGTTIHVLLPLRDLPDHVEKAPPPRSYLGRRILIVDDEPDVLDVAVRMASELGLITDAVLSGEDALYRLEETSDFDLILMDLSMPGMGGAAAAGAALALNPSLPILLSSGYSAEGLPEGLLWAGVGFLPKPCSLDALKATLDQHIDPGPAGQLG